MYIYAVPVHIHIISINVCKYNNGIEFGKKATRKGSIQIGFFSSVAPCRGIGKHFWQIYSDKYLISFVHVFPLFYFSRLCSRQSLLL